MNPKRSSRWATALPILALVVAFGIAWLTPRGAGAEGQVAPQPRITERAAADSSSSLQPTRRGFLGVHVVELTPELGRHLGAPEGQGVLVSRVVSGSPAEAAGVQVGDVLVRVDTVPVTSASALRRALASHGEGALVDLEVYREGHRLSLAPVLVARPASRGDVTFRLPRGEKGTLEPFAGEDWERFAQRMAELGERIGLMGLELGEEVGRRVAEELAPALERLLEPELRLRIEEALERWEQEGLPQLEESLRELERRLQELE